MRCNIIRDVSAKLHVTGVVTGVPVYPDTKTVDVGFTPSFVILYRSSNSDSSILGTDNHTVEGDELVKVLTGEYADEYNCIIPNGFKLMTAGSTATFYYIAFK